MKIDPNKKYWTRDGQEVKHLYRVPDGYPTEYPWRGIAGSMEESWTDDGKYDIASENDDFDLIEVREPREWMLSVVTEKVFNDSHRLGYAIGTASSYRDGDEDDGYEIVRVREIID